MEQDPDRPNFSLSPEEAEAAAAKIQAIENFPLGIMAGFTAALIGAGVWAGIAVATNLKIAFVAIGIGFLVGVVIRVAGNGETARFSYLGAGLSFFSCLLGNILTIFGFLAKDYGVGFFEVVKKINYASIPERLAVNFSPMDLLFYGLAIYAGYRYSVTH